MENCIARGGISHVLAQARASLKNPSRPFTPKSGTRPLFHGDDYRPSSRPSSTFSQDGSEFEKPKAVTRKSKPRSESIHVDDNQDHVPERPMSPFLSSREEELNAGPQESDVVDDGTAAYATPESIAATLHQLHGALEENAIDTVTKLTHQVFHDVHLLRHDFRGTCVLVEDAFLNCVEALLNRLNETQEDHVIPLAHAAIQLCSCNLAPWSSFEPKLIHATKLLFLQSKDAANDSLFFDAALVETLLGVLPAPSTTSSKQISKKGNITWPTQVLIYISGTLKNVSESSRMVKMLATNGAIDILTKTLQTGVASSSHQDSNAIAQMLVQVTAILRNLAVHKQCHKQFWHSNVTQTICDLIPLYSNHNELVLNASRVLSKLTLHESGRNQLNKSNDNLKHLLELLVTPKTRQQPPLVVRLVFVLGNLTATNDRNRKALLHQPGFLPSLLNLMAHFHQIYANNRIPDASHGDDADDVEVLVKIVRLLANVAINSAAGQAIGSFPGVEELFDLLDLAKSSGDEELMLNVVSCLTNLSFYATDATPTNALAIHRLRVCISLASILGNSNEEAVVEAARAYGNLSRFPDVLGEMVDGSDGILSNLVMLLDHTHRDIVLTVCGVLMNAALDPRTRSVLQNVQVGSNLVDARDILVTVFRSAGLRDLAMSTIVCKVLYNLVLSVDTIKYTDTKTGRLLLETLQELIDVMDEETPSEEEAEFVGVARALVRNLHGSPTSLRK